MVFFFPPNKMILTNKTCFFLRSSIFQFQFLTKVRMKCHTVIFTLIKSCIWRDRGGAQESGRGCWRGGGDGKGWGEIFYVLVDFHISSPTLMTRISSFPLQCQGKMMNGVSWKFYSTILIFFVCLFDAIL